MQVCIFEDYEWQKFLPLVHLRPIYDLRCGTMSLRDKILRFYPKIKVSLFTRESLIPILQEKTKYNINFVDNTEELCLFINGRVLMTSPIPLEGPEEIGMKNSTVVYARLKKEHYHLMVPSICFGRDLIAQFRDKFRIVKSDMKLVNYFYELVHNNPEQIKADLKQAKVLGIISGKVYEGVHIIDKKQVYIGKESVIKPGVVLDNENGPIYIGENVTIQPNAVIEGPAYIGSESIVRMGAKIRGGTTIGEVSRVGGEVECSIIHSYSNKQHDGFLGHSYIAPWCNLGAGTNNSDLKNNYSTVKVYVEGKFIDSGSMFVGLTMADHSKSGIGTIFNTGTVVGISCNVFGGDYPPKFIPSFSWGGASGLTVYDIEKAIDTAKKVMLRRKIILTETEEKLLRKIFNETIEEYKFNQ